MPSGSYDTPNFPSSPSHLPFSLYLFYFSFWPFPLLFPALPPPDNARLLFTFLLFLFPPLLNYSFLSLWGISCFLFCSPSPSPPPMPISTMIGCHLLVNKSQLGIVHQTSKWFWESVLISHIWNICFLDYLWGLKKAGSDSFCFLVPRILLPPDQLGVPQGGHTNL